MNTHTLPDCQLPLGVQFWVQLGTDLSPRTVYNNFKQVAASIGYSNVRPHDLCFSNTKPKVPIFLLFRVISSDKNRFICFTQRFQTHNSS